MEARSTHPEGRGGRVGVNDSIAQLSEEMRREYEAYLRMKGDLLKKYEGKVVLIKDGRLVGVYDSEEEAFLAALEKFGPVPVLIKRVRREERPEEIPALTLGLSGATL